MLISRQLINELFLLLENLKMAIEIFVNKWFYVNFVL